MVGSAAAHTPAAAEPQAKPCAAWSAASVFCKSSGPVPRPGDPPCDSPPSRSSSSTGRAICSFPVCSPLRTAARLNAAVPELYARREAYNVREKGKDAVRTNFAAHLYSEPFARLARHPRMIEPVEDLFDEQLYMHQLKINGKMAFEGDVWQWHQDYGTWKNDDLMPTERAMNVAIFLDASQRVQRAADVHPRQPQARGDRREARPLDHQLPAVDGGQRADHAVGRTRRRTGQLRRAGPLCARGHRQSQGTGRVDDPLPQLPGACEHQQPEPVEPGECLPEPVAPSATTSGGHKRPEYIAHRDFTPITCLPDDCLLRDYPVDVPWKERPARPARW